MVSEFEFIQNKITGRWVISAPRRAHRPDDLHKANICPFCPESHTSEKEIFSLGEVRVLPNKYPFAPIHEVIIHSNDHHKNFGELGEEQTRHVFETYKQRYNTHKTQGQVYIFHNRGEQAGESLTHPHSQLAVIPENVHLEIPPLDLESDIERIETTYYYIFCPITSEWPDEVWIVPKTNNMTFGETTDEEISELSGTLTKLIKILGQKHGREFPYNFYIYPKENWYLRIIPRVRTLGGFEVGTNVSVNTQDPQETFEFLKSKF